MLRRLTGVAALCVAGTAHGGTTWFPDATSFGTLLFEDQFPCAGDADFNDVVLRYQYRKVDAAGLDRHLTATFEVVAHGASLHSGLALRLPVSTAAIGTVTLRIGDPDSADGAPWGPPQTLTPEDVGGTPVLWLVDDVRTWCGGASGFLNTEPTRAVTECAPVVVDITFPAGVIVPAQEPFDVFVHRSGDRSHQIHQSRYYPPTSGSGAFDTSLFAGGASSCDDGSDGPAGTRWFVQGASGPIPGLPFVLDVGEGVSGGRSGLHWWMQEHRRIDSGAPRIVELADGPGDGDPGWDWYLVGTVPAHEFTGGAGGTAPPAATPNPLAAYDQDRDGYCPGFDAHDDGMPDDCFDGTAAADCDDADGAVNPGATETWYDGIDQDCAGDDDFDQDGDGEVVGDDCDDEDALVFPGAPEDCNGLDDDCDGTSDCDEGVCGSPSDVCPTCDDGVHNGFETDVDCGGGECAECDTGDSCDVDDDCVSGVCSGTCQAPTCADGVQNGAETAVDCGGSCPACWALPDWAHRRPIDLAFTAYPAGSGWAQVPIDIDQVCYGFTLPRVLMSYHFEGSGDRIDSHDGHAGFAPLTNGGSYGTGHEGLGLVLNGSSYVNLQDIVPSGNKLTMAGWFRAPSTPTTTASILQAWKGAEIYDLGVMPNGGNCSVNTSGTHARFYTQVHPVGMGEDNLCGTTAIVPNAWYFVTATFDGRYLRIYTDGVLQGTVDYGTSPTSFTTTAPDVLLGTTRDINAFITATLDDVLLLDDALTQPQIAQLRAPSCKRDLSDLRFYSETGGVLPYWVESDKRVWVRMPTGPHALWVYYGNPSAPVVASGPSTFEVFDTFSGGIDGSWTTGTNCGLPDRVTGVNGKVRATANCTTLETTSSYASQTWSVAADVYRFGADNHGCWDYWVSWQSAGATGALRYDFNGIDGVHASTSSTPCGDQTSIPGASYNLGTLRWTQPPTVNSPQYTMTYESLHGLTVSHGPVNGTGSMKGPLRWSLAAHPNTPRYLDNVRAYIPSTSTVSFGAEQTPSP